MRSLQRTVRSWPWSIRQWQGFADGEANRWLLCKNWPWSLQIVFHQSLSNRKLQEFQHSVYQTSTYSEWNSRKYTWENEPKMQFTYGFVNDLWTLMFFFVCFFPVEQGKSSQFTSLKPKRPSKTVWSKTKIKEWGKVRHRAKKFAAVPKRTYLKVFFFSFFLSSSFLPLPSPFLSFLMRK